MRALAWLFGFVFAAGAVADPCRYEVFRPEALFRQVVRDARVAGLSVVEARFAVPGLPSGRTSLLRDGGVVAQLEFVEDIQKGQQRFIVHLPAENRIKLMASELKAVCPADPPVGLCRATGIWTDLQPPLGKYMAFLTRWGPLGALPEYFRYSARVDYATFALGVAEARRWLTGVLLTTSSVYRPTLRTGEERIRWACASDPLVAPYLDRFTVGRSTRDPRMVAVYGVVPSNALYGRVIDCVRAAGYPYVDPRLIIDTRTRLPVVVPPPEECNFPG